MRLDIDSNGLKGIEHHWTLLRNFSPDMISQYDHDSDGLFNAVEQSEIFQNAFSNSKRYHYFTFIDINGSTYVPSSIENFRAFIDGDKVIYSFYIPCEIPAIQSFTSLDIVIYDPTSYVSFGFLNLDDEVDPNIHYLIDFVRDGNIYSHTNDLGQLHLLIDMRLKENVVASNRQTTSLKVVPISSVEKVPEQTVNNPFISTGTFLENDIKANPFLR